MLRPFSMSYKAQVLADSPVIYLNFAGDSLTNNLGSRSGVTVNSSTVASYAAGIQNRAPVFGGSTTSAHVSYNVNTNNIFNGSTWTVEAWYKRDTNQSDYSTIFFTASGNSQIQLFQWNSSTTDARKLFARYKDTSGNVITLKSTAAYTDTNWHHLVLTTDGTTVRFYVDGVQQATGTHYTQSIASGTPVMLASYGTSTGNENAYGSIDEVAMYNTNLSSTRVTAHYNARNDVDVDAAGVTAATATGLAVDPVVHPIKLTTDFSDGANPFSLGSVGGTPKVYTNSTALETSLNTLLFAPNGEVLFRTPSGMTPTQTVHFSFTSGTWTGGSTSIPANSWVRLRNNGTGNGYSRKVWAVGQPEPTTWSNVTTSGTGTDNAPLKFSNQSSTKNFQMAYLAANEGGTVVLPDAVGVADPATATATAVDPAVSIASHVNYSASAATGSGLMVDPGFSNATDRSVAAAVATATGSMADPAVSLIRNVSVAAEPATASAEGPLGGYNSPVTVSVAPATASGASVDPAVTSDRNAAVTASVAAGTAVAPGPLLEVDGVVVNPDLASDEYFQRLLLTTDSGDYWYRLDETSGTVIHEERDAAKDAALFGTYSFGVYGPESRKAIHFENGYAKPVGSGDSQGGIDSESSDIMTFEVVMRTTDANGILAYGLDNKPQNAVFRNAIYLKDGKVSIEWNRLDGGPKALSLTGVKNVADGNWHHIVVTVSNGNARELDNGIRIYIDGVLDIRRRYELVPDLWATPDSYFGMPEAWRNVTPLYPWQDNITADVMEVVFRRDGGLIQDQAIDLFYAVFGIKPIRVEPAVGYGQAPDAKGRGNRKVALVLYTKWNAGGLALDPRIGYESNSPTGADPTTPDEFDHPIDIGRIFEPGEANYLLLQDYRVIARPIMREDAGANLGPYRDPVTDLPRLINVKEDIGYDNFDVIVFRNWPDEGGDQQVWAARGYDNASVESFLGSVRQAVIDGKGLEVTNPNLASRLGLISGAEPISNNYEMRGGRAIDARAAAVNPWDNDKIDTAYLDQHGSNWHRVVANVPNLTDLNGEHIYEAYMTYNSSANGEVPNRWGYKLSEAPLGIGTELLDPVAFWLRKIAFEQSANPNVATATANWDKKVWAIKPDGLVSGTALYKFSNQMWAGNSQASNPYKDYIGGAILQPGDTWNGTRIAGKVFINLAEMPYYSTDAIGTMPRQLVPPNSEIPNPNAHEDAAKREWDYSYARVQSASTGGTSTDQSNKIQAVQAPDGSLQFVQVKGKGSAVGTTEFETYPTEQVIVPTWAHRGLAWLMEESAVGSGDVIIRPNAVEGSGTAPAPAVLAQKSVTVPAQAANAIGALVAPAEAHDPDVAIPVLPFDGYGAMTGYGKTITVEPFTGSGELVDNFDLINAAGEQVVVYLHYTDAVVYLKEDM